VDMPGHWPIVDAFAVRRACAIEARPEPVGNCFEVASRRVSNGDQVNRVAALALKRGKSVDFTGYWQRHVAE
jgi:hypothetical protein